MTFGLPVDPWDKGNGEIQVSESRIVCCKAATTLQGLAISSRQILPSSDVEGQARKRTYCPSTYRFGEEVFALGQHSDQLAGAGTPAILADECTIPVICNLSKKHQKQPKCVSSHAASTIPLELIIPLVSYYQIWGDRVVKLDAEGEFRSKTHMDQSLNEFLRAAPNLNEMPPVNDDNEIYVYISGRKMAYKVCAGTDEEISPI